MTSNNNSNRFTFGRAELAQQYFLQKTVDIHPPKTGISVHFSDSFILMALQI